LLAADKKCFILPILDICMNLATVSFACNVQEFQIKVVVGFIS